MTVETGSRTTFFPQLLPLVASCTGALAFFALCFRAYHLKCPIWFDGPVLGIQEGIRTGRIYHSESLLTPPYLVVTHPPLSYLLGYPIYAAGGGAAGLRLLTVCVILACAAMIYMLSRSRREAGFHLSALFAATVFLIFPPVFRWSQLVRCPDSLSCLFDLGAIWVLLHTPKNRRREVLVGLLFFLAILSKQSAILTFGPVFLLDGLQDRQAVRLIWIRLAAVSLPTLMFVNLMQWWSHGGFLTNVIFANIMGPNIPTFLGDIVFELKFFWLFAILVVLFLARDAPPLMRRWFLVSVIVGLGTDWKDGANSVYFFEASASLAILAGAAFRNASSGLSWRPWAKCAALASPIGMILIVSDAYGWSMSDPKNAEEYGNLISYLEQQKTPGCRMLTQDISLSSALGEEPVWNDALVLGVLAQQGRWDDRFVVSELHQRHFYAVVSMVDHFWTPALNKELRAQYKIGAKFGGTFEHTVYVPKQSSSCSK